MKNRNRYLAILLALVIACSVSCKKTDNGPDTDEKDHQSASDTISDTEKDKGTEGVSDEVPSDSISGTEEQTEEDTTPAVTEPDSDTEAVTDEITEDTEPVVDDPAPADPDAGENDTPDASGDEVKVPVGTERSGSFVSEEHPNLQLVVDWDYVILSDGMAQVTLDVGLSHYRLFSQKKVGMGTFTVDGVSTYFSTEAIAHDENTKTVTPFFTEVVTTPLDEMEISVEWIVLGTYGGVEVESLTVDGTIVFEP
ncbi:MAG: hypothetical protein IJC98_07490 [Clostridia bacterium]|nr:hypothetical protein [Clostridia bacterium]